MKNYALFSTTGRFIGFTNFKPDNGLYKEMPDNFNPVEYVYAGDYETGSLKHINELTATDYREGNVDKKWKVFETELNVEAYNIITKEKGYEIFKQLNIIMDVLVKNEGKIDLTEEFKEMYKTILNTKYNIQNSIESYKQAPKAEVITKENEDAFFDNYTRQHLNINI